MSYYFVNNKYPVSDPNIDLNFNNDILYNHIVGDDAIVDPKPYDNADQSPRRGRKPDRGDITPKEPTYNILLSFILIVILVAIVFYMTRNSSKSTSKTANMSQSGGRFNPHLVMLGPRF